MLRNEIKFMQAAAALADEGNFGRAAQRLRITQPTLTKHISQLQKRLRIRLFQRENNSIVVTDAGRSFVEHSRLALFHSERAVQDAKATTGTPEGLLRVGRSLESDPFFSSTLASLRLPLHPQLRLELTSGFSCDLIRDLLSGKVDLALVTQPVKSALVSATKISEDPLFVAFAEDSPLASKAVLRLQDLDGKSWATISRTAHPLLYGSLYKLASLRNVSSEGLLEVLAPEEAFLFLLDPQNIGLFTKNHALRIARNGLTLRPLVENNLFVTTCLVSRSDDTSRLTSEVVRAFVRKLRAFDEEEAPKPIPVTAKSARVVKA